MKKCLLLLFILLISNIFLSAQETKVTRDFGVWLSVGLKKEVKDFDFEFSQKLRTNTNTSELDDLISDFGVKYTLNKHFKFGGNVRYIIDFNQFKKTKVNTFRYNLDIISSFKVRKKLKINYRLRFQREYEDLSINIDDYFSEIRNKIELSYKKNNLLNPYISVELFRLIERFRNPYFNKIRFLIGNNFKLNKSNKFSLALGINREINEPSPATFYFIKTGYVYKF